MTAPELLAQAIATCRDCGESFPFGDPGYVDDEDGFVRCLGCRSGAKVQVVQERPHDAGPLFGAGG